MCSAKIFFAIIFNEIKCHVNTSFRLVGRMHPVHPSHCVRAWAQALKGFWLSFYNEVQAKKLGFRKGITVCCEKSLSQQPNKPQCNLLLTQYALLFSSTRFLNTSHTPSNDTLSHT